MRVTELLAVCFALLTAALLWPLLTAANRPALVAGLPLLVLYLFAVWALAIGVVAWVAWRLPDEEPP